MLGCTGNTSQSISGKPSGVSPCRSLSASGCLLYRSSPTSLDFLTADGHLPWALPETETNGLLHWSMLFSTIALKLVTGAD
jgi:hypothetical protein